MSDIEFQCPHCDVILEGTSDMAGTTLKCPSCNNQITVPKQKVVMTVPKRQISLRKPVTTMQLCPYCGEEILKVATKCKHCGSDLLKNSSPQYRTPRTSMRMTSACAVWSLILGIFGLFLGLTSIPAIICGHVARSNIRNSKGTLTGEGIALAGLIMGYLTIVVVALCFFLGVFAAIAIPAFGNARDTAQHNGCINNLRMIDSAKEQAALANRWASGVDCDNSSRKQIVNTYIKGNSTPDCPGGGTYVYDKIGTNPRCSIPGHELPIYSGGD